MSGVPEPDRTDDDIDDEELFDAVDVSVSLNVDVGAEDADDSNIEGTLQSSTDGATLTMNLKQQAKADMICIATKQNGRQILNTIYLHSFHIQHVKWLSSLHLPIHLN